MSTENEKQPNEQPNRENPPQQSWNEYFRLRWNALRQFISAHVGGHQGDDQKSKPYSEAIGCFTANWLKIVFSSLIISAGIYLLIVVGIFDDSNKVIALLTLVLAIVGGLQWWTYHRQWHVMREQLQKTDELVMNSRLDHRPWIIVDPPKINWDGAGKEASCRLIVRNIGKSPGKVITCKKGIFPISTEVHPWDIGKLPSSFAENRIIETWKRNWAIPPGGALNLTLSTVNPISTEDAERIEKDYSHICIWGEVEYQDVFDDIHLTEFQFMYHGSDKTVYTDDWHNSIK